MLATEPDSVTLIPLNDAGKHFANHPHKATIWRWAFRGVVKDGVAIRLGSQSIGARRYTTLDDIAEFVRRCNQRDNAQQPTLSASFQRRAEAAGAVLDSMLTSTRSRRGK